MKGVGQFRPNFHVEGTSPKNRFCMDTPVNAVQLCRSQYSGFLVQSHGKNEFRYLEPFRRCSRVWRTDGRTGRQTERPLAIAPYNIVRRVLNIAISVVKADASWSHTHCQTECSVCSSIFKKPMNIPESSNRRLRLRLYKLY